MSGCNEYGDLHVDRVWTQDQGEFALSKGAKTLQLLRAQQEEGTTFMLHRGWAYTVEGGLSKVPSRYSDGVRLMRTRAATSLGRLLRIKIESALLDTLAQGN